MLTSASTCHSSTSSLARSSGSGTPRKGRVARRSGLHQASVEWPQCSIGSQGGSVSGVARSVASTAATIMSEPKSPGHTHLEERQVEVDDQQPEEDELERGGEDRAQLGGAPGSPSRGRVGRGASEHTIGRHARRAGGELPRIDARERTGPTGARPPVTGAMPLEPAPALDASPAPARRKPPPALGARLRSLASDAALYGVANGLARVLTFLLVPLHTNVLTPAEYGPIGTVYGYIALLTVLYVVGLEAAYLRFAAALGRRTSAPFSTPFLFLAPSGSPRARRSPSSPAGSRAALGLAGSEHLVAPAALLVLLDTLGVAAARPAPARAARARPTRPSASLRSRSTSAPRSSSSLGSTTAPSASSRPTSAPRRARSSSSSRSILAASRPRSTGPCCAGSSASRCRSSRPGSRSSSSSPPTARILQKLTDDATVGIYQASSKLAVPMLLARHRLPERLGAVLPRPLRATPTRDRSSPASSPTSSRSRPGVLLADLACSSTGSWRCRSAAAARSSTARYWPGIAVVPWLLLGYVAYGVYANLGAGPVPAQPHPRFLVVAGGAAPSSTSPRAWLLVPRFGMRGAALGICLAYAVMAPGCGLAARRVYPLAIEWAAARPHRALRHPPRPPVRAARRGRPRLPSAPPPRRLPARPRSHPASSAAASSPPCAASPAGSATARPASAPPDELPLPHGGERASNPQLSCRFKAIFSIMIAECTRGRWICSDWSRIVRFFFGARQAGKSTLLRQAFPGAVFSTSSRRTPSAS